MKITMDGKWAQRVNPTRQVQVLCTSVNGAYSVAYLTPRRKLVTTTDAGVAGTFTEGDLDLVPLQEPHSLDGVEPGTPVFVRDYDTDPWQLKRFVRLTANGLVQTECSHMDLYWKYGLTYQQYVEKYL